MTYILKKDCQNIGKEVGDIYNGEYGDSKEKIADLIERGIIEEEECQTCGGSGEVSLDADDGEGHIQRGVDSAPCPDCQPSGAEEEYDDQD